MNYIDLSCPAEIFRTAPPTADIPAATLTLFNLSDRVIASVEVLLRLLDASGGELERLSFRGRALNGRPHSTFLLTVPCAVTDGLKSVDATVEKVWFADNDTWRRNPANEVGYIPNAHFFWNGLIFDLIQIPVSESSASLQPEVFSHELLISEEVSSLFARFHAAYERFSSSII